MADTAQEEAPLAETGAVAILVLTYNHQDYIGTCLLSILECDFSDSHIWVLDDGSSDGTCAVVRQVADQFGRITLITQAQSGGRTSANSQRLIEELKGKYVLSMSGDDMLGPSFPLSRTVAALEADEHLALVIPRLVYLMQDPSQEAPSIYAKEFLSALRSSDPQRVLQDHLYRTVSRVFLQGVVVRRSVIDAVGGFDTQLLADDYAFVLRLFQYMAKVRRHFAFDEESLWLYRVHSSNAHRMSMRQFVLILQVAAKYIPEVHWAGMAWDTMVFENADQMMQARSEAERLLGPAVADLVMKPIGRATLRAARKRVDGQLLRQVLLDGRIEPRLRFHALISLLRIMTVRSKRREKAYRA